MIRTIVIKATMKNLQIVIGPIFILIFGNFCAAQNSNPRPIIHDLSAALTDVMIVDGFSPPQASRAYYYSHVAYYEVIRQQKDEYITLAGQLNGLDSLPAAADGVNLNYAAAVVFKKIAASIVYHREIMDEKANILIADMSTSLDKETVKQSTEYAELIVSRIAGWMSSDNYTKLKGLPRYQLKKQPYAWEPTPPGYHDALEPNWYYLRTATLDSASQFLPKHHISFDTAKTSEFYVASLEVYNTVNALTEEEHTIAKFWDCNPLQTRVEGHFMFAAKQMTPGGHWMAITGIACVEKRLSEAETSSVYANVAIGLFDGFITSWKAKFVYDLIRPETYINRYIDPNWRPVLETPPFPEYTSAHSVISMTAAQILNDRIGPITYKDTVETRWGYPSRTFDSFIKAAEEVSDSRVYGGIHYRMGVDLGIWQGNMLGEHIKRKIEFVSQ